MSWLKIYLLHYGLPALHHYLISASSIVRLLLQERNEERFLFVQIVPDYRLKSYAVKLKQVDPSINPLLFNLPHRSPLFSLMTL